MWTAESSCTGRSQAHRCFSATSGTLSTDIHRAVWTTMGGPPRRETFPQPPCGSCGRSAPHGYPQAVDNSSCGARPVGHGSVSLCTQVWMSLWKAASPVVHRWGRTSPRGEDGTRTHRPGASPERACRWTRRPGQRGQGGQGGTAQCGHPARKASSAAYGCAAHGRRPRSVRLSPVDQVDCWRIRLVSSVTWL